MYNVLRKLGKINFPAILFSNQLFTPVNFSEFNVFPRTGLAMWSG